MSAKRGVPGWVWLLAVVPAAIIGLGMLAALATYGVRRYIAASKQAETAGDAVAAARSARGPELALDGGASDLSSVMGRARKLADQWQPEAALLGIEATLHAGMIRTQEGASAKLTFGPSRFAAAPTRDGFFVVVYDTTGIRGAPSTGSAAPALPEPMCAPERVLPRVRDLGDGAILLRYALDVSERPMWLANPIGVPEQLRLVDPQDCQVRGLVASRKRR